MSGFKVGELILSSKPFAYALSNIYRGLYCDSCCSKRQDLKRCGGCSFLYFCDRNCQIQAWNDHKLECKYIKAAGVNKPDPMFRMLCLIILKIKKYGQEEPYEEVNGRKVSFSTLMSHATDIYQDPHKLRYIKAVANVVKKFIGADNMPNFEDFVKVFGKMYINSHGITNNEIHDIGDGLYLGGSIFNHSCDPDAVVLFDGTTLNVKMIKDVSHRDINKVYVSYIDNLRSKEARQKSLKENFYFTCQCSFCLTPQNEELMSKLIDDSEETKKKAIECEEKFEKLYELYKINIAKDQALINVECKNLLKSQSEVMSDTNVCKVRTLEILFDTSSRLKKFEEAARYGACMEEAYRLYKGKYNPLLGVHLFQLGKILHSCLMLSQQAVPKLEEAEAILKLSHGIENPYFKDLQKLIGEAKLVSSSPAFSQFIQTAKKFMS